MSDIKQLREICQTTAKNDVSNVYMRYVSRFVSIYVTRLLLPTGITAGQVSFAMILTGVVSALFFFCPEKAVFLIGAVILQLWYILDCCDGEVARYRDYEKRKVIINDKTALPITGSYWDYLNHYIVHGLVPFALGFAVFMTRGNISWILIGFGASFFQMLLLAVHDTKMRGFIAKIKKHTSAHDDILLREKPMVVSGERAKRWGLFKWVFVVIHHSTTFPTVMNVLTLCAMVTVFSVWDLRALFVVYYAAASALVFIFLAGKSLIDNGLDKEFDDLFQIGKELQ